MRNRRRSRPGFTLLEVILATTIALLLLGALYVAVDMQLGYAQMSRDNIEQSTVAREVLARMDADAARVVALSDPARFRFAAGLDTPDVTSSSAMTTPNANATTNNNTTNSNNSNSSDSSTTTSAGTNAPIVLPLGVMGDSETLHLFVSDVPPELFTSGLNFNSQDQSNTPPVVSDLRRVSYWLVGGGDSPLGLARQEVPLVTSDDALQNLPPGLDNEASFILAEEVRSLSFQYFDGTEWQDSWDSTTLGPDGVTPVGSPAAIAVVIGLADLNAGPQQAGAPLKMFRHVLLIPSANGAPQQSQTGQQTTPSNQNGSGVAP
jgi:prepilin-type N-terminal cleavage/methylation domain-containing protein